MNPELWPRVEELFHAALDLSPDARGAFLEKACGEDADLRRHVELLISNDEHAGTLLEKPILADVMAQPETEDSFLPTNVVNRASAGSTKPSRIGTRVGTYEFVSLLGAGGMGEVYRAHDTKLRRDVAIKVLPALLANDPSRVSRFQREALTLAALNHPYIGAIYGLEETDNGYALVLELIEGPTLAQRLAKGRTIPIREALSIARQIAEALEAAHEKGIIHRDLKPANIKVTPAGTVKVLDFGLAKALAVESHTGLSQVPSGAEDGMMVGTPTYMSPEQARGQPVSKQTDIWALGCVLYEMLTGRPPFHGESVGEVIAEILKSEPDWNLLPADAPPQIRTLLRRCLQKETNRRLKDAGDARIEINEAINAVRVATGQDKDDPLIIELPKGGYIPVIRNAQGTNQSAALAEDIKPAGRRLWATAALACLVVVLAGVGWWRLHPQNAPVPIAVLPLINLNQDPAYDYFADGLTGELIRNLSIIDGLTVRSETSSFTFKGKPQQARDAGKQLEADYLVEGSVLRSGQQLRINVDLVRARDDFPIWSARYDRELTDVFAIQDDISRGVVNNLRLKLGQGRRRYETSTEAYDLYLRARALQISHAGDPSPRIPFLEQAIAKDPSFAPAYAGLAVAHLTRSGQAGSDALTEVAEMRAAAEKAIELDPLSAESYDALGAAYAREAQWDQADKSFRRSMELQPGRQESHGYYAMYYLLPLARVDQAIRQLQIAEKSAPIFMWFLGDALTDVGRNEEAAVVCNRLPPDYPLNNQCIPGIMVRQGKAAEVIQTYGALPDNLPPIRSVLGCAYARAGRRDEAERVAATFHFPGAGFPYAAVLFACLGDKDRVFETLDHVAQVGPIRMGWFLLRVDREHPGLLSGDPRLKALRKKVGLPE